MNIICVSKIKNMLKKNFNMLCCLVLFAFIFSLSAVTYAEYTINNNDAGDEVPFSDVPGNSSERDAIFELKRMGITNGIGNNLFGYGKTITRGEFLTFLAKLAGWKMVSPWTPSFSDNRDKGKFYYAPVETAFALGVISGNNGAARPEDPITREEAVIMLIRCLGLGDLAERLNYLEPPYVDVAGSKGYVAMAEDFGILDGIVDETGDAGLQSMREFVTGIAPENAPGVHTENILPRNAGDTGFNPGRPVFREEAAVMLVRFRKIMDSNPCELNGFYAISSSSQHDKIASLTSVCFGWSRLDFDPSSGSITVNTSDSRLGFNEFYLPQGFSTRLKAAKDAGVPALLNIYSSQDSKMTDPLDGSRIGIPEYLLSNPAVRKRVAGEIASSARCLSRNGETGSFDGVSIDFEGLKGEKLKNLFNDFIKELKAELDKNGMLLYVAVHPLMHPKRSAASMDGYDYRTIGAHADKVILMAHDYNAKSLSEREKAMGFNITPLTPVEDVYYALRMITDDVNGVEDRNKIMLQVSFDWAVWRKKGGKTLNSRPDSFNLENFISLLNNRKDIKYYYSEEYKNPYIKYTDSKTGVEYTVWYENTRSVMEKAKLAGFFGIRGISLWRLGTIPDYNPGNGNNYEMDVWQNLMKELKKE